jgi:type II pantothenate kinase
MSGAGPVPPRTLPERSLGIDAGASLVKLVYAGSTAPVQRSFAAREREAVLSYALGAGAEVIGVTGGGARSLAAQLPGARSLPEFEAWAAGAPLLARLAGIELPEAYLLVSLGTGVSVSLVRGGRGVRVGGTALGGGSLLGLGRLLLGTSDFTRLVELARRGDRRRVDLSVGDLYAEGDAPLPPDVPASHFAKLDSTAPEDVAAALIGAIGHNLGLICGQLALSHGARAVLYCGSALDQNEPLREVLAWQTGAYGPAVHFPEHGAYCGALGAALLAAA